MSISNATENALLLLIFNATTWANYAINATASPETDIIVALHTADPADGGAQNTTEAGYTSYARVAVVRTGSGWTVTAASVSPVASIDFPSGGGGSGTVTHFSTGKSGGGASAILFSGTVSPNVVTGSGIQPKLTTATAITLD